VICRSIGYGKNKLQFTPDFDGEYLRNGWRNVKSERHDLGLLGSHNIIGHVTIRLYMWGFL